MLTTTTAAYGNRGILARYVFHLLKEQGPMTSMEMFGHVKQIGVSAEQLRQIRNKTYREGLKVFQYKSGYWKTASNDLFPAEDVETLKDELKRWATRTSKNEADIDRLKASVTALTADVLDLKNNREVIGSRLGTANGCSTANGSSGNVIGQEPVEENSQLRDDCKARPESLQGRYLTRGSNAKLEAAMEDQYGESATEVLQQPQSNTDTNECLPGPSNVSSTTAVPIKVECSFANVAVQKRSEKLLDVEKKCRKLADTLSKIGSKISMEYRTLLCDLELTVRALQREFELGRIDYLDEIRRQGQHVKLFQQILEKVQPCLRRDSNYSNLEEIKNEAV